MTINKKKKPKRYSSREATIATIDREQEALTNSMKLAEEYDTEIQALKEWFGLYPMEHIKTEADRDEWHGKHGRLTLLLDMSGIRHRSVPRHLQMRGRLKATLASYDTSPMLGIVPDGSVLLAEAKA